MRNRIDLLRHAEQARIARWFRDSDHGCMAYDERNRAIPLTTDEAAL